MLLFPASYMSNVFERTQGRESRFRLDPVPSLNRRDDAVMSETRNVR